MTEYAFDVKLNAVIRVEATTEADARAVVVDMLDAMDVSEWYVRGYNDAAPPPYVKVTEVSLSQDGGMWLFEVDGEDTDEPFDAPG
jgi:hypothetical protein